MEKVEGVDAEEAARRHAELHFGGVGVDAPQPTDQYYKLLVDRCFYVGGMGSKCQAEVIIAPEYMVRRTHRRCNACLLCTITCRCWRCSAHSCLLLCIAAQVGRRAMSGRRGPLCLLMV